MSPRLPASLAAALLALAAMTGCFGGLRQPTDGQTEVVEASAPTLAAAKRRGVAEFIDLFVSSAAASASAAVVEREILAHPDRYIVRFQVERASAAARAVGDMVEIKALVAYQKLGWDLARLGLTRPPAVWARAALSGVPRPAAAGLTRVLVRRGLSVVELAPSGDRQAALKAARGAGADWLFVGSAKTSRSADRRLRRIPVAKASLRVEAVRTSSGEGQAFVSEAVAADSEEEGAADKALENAGSLLAERWRSADSEGGDRREVVAVVLGLKGLPEARKTLEQLRAAAGVVSAALEARRGYETRFRLYMNGRSSVLAEALARRPSDLKISSVEPHAIELQTRSSSEEGD